MEDLQEQLPEDLQKRLAKCIDPVRERRVERVSEPSAFCCFFDSKMCFWGIPGAYKGQWMLGFSSFAWLGWSWLLGLFLQAWLGSLVE